ncbi:MAG TPA: 30S ribosomal protein S6 [Thermoanaerobaculia bacterium]|nr:30S ribosomal protein S6 [Thermoanaerobaculia bacterium]
MRTYDVLYILSPQVTEEEATTLTTEFKRVAESLGATLKNEEAWGRRRLAYPINKSTEGIYHLLVYETVAGLSELDRRMKNSDRVLRHMIVRTDEDLKRADKLAKKNPKKERVRPAAPQAYAPTPAAAPAPAPVAAPVPAAVVAAAPVEEPVPPAEETQA